MERPDRETIPSSSSDVFTSIEGVDVETLAASFDEDVHVEETNRENDGMEDQLIELAKMCCRDSEYGSRVDVRIGALGVIAQMSAEEQGVRTLIGFLRRESQRSDRTRPSLLLALSRAAVLPLHNTRVSPEETRIVLHAATALANITGECKSLEMFDEDGVRSLRSELIPSALLACTMSSIAATSLGSLLGSALQNITARDPQSALYALKLFKRITVAISVRIETSNFLASVLYNASAAHEGRSLFVQDEWLEVPLSYIRDTIASIESERDFTNDARATLSACFSLSSCILNCVLDVEHLPAILSSFGDARSNRFVSSLSGVIRQALSVPDKACTFSLDGFHRGWLKVIERLALSLVGVGATKEGRECLLETGSYTVLWDVERVSLSEDTVDEIKSLYRVLKEHELLVNPDAASSAQMAYETFSRVPEGGTLVVQDDLDSESTESTGSHVDQGPSSSNSL